jgi:cobalt-zinc-cadmium efflux system protein
VLVTHEHHTNESRLRLALALNAMLVLAQVVVGITAHSVGLLADAGHNVTDVAAVVVSLIAIRLARRRPTTTHSFGFHRSTILAAQANAAGILAITALLAYEGVRRLMHPAHVHGLPVLIVALGAAVINAIAAAGLGGHDHGNDLNMRSARLHMAGDAVASLGVAAAGGVILATGGNYWVDPAVSLAIAALIGFQAWKLLRDTAAVLLESTPTGVSSDDIATAILAVDGVDQVHDLHVWSLSSEVHALSAHVVVSGHPSLEDAQLVGNAVKEAVRGPFAITHATLELECESCTDDGSWCAIEAVTPATGRQPRSPTP